MVRETEISMDLISKLFWLSVNVVGTIGTVALIVGGIVTIIAWIRGIFKPLWRLGLGLSKKKITIIGSSDDCESLSSTLEQSDLFSKKNIGHITSPNDAKDLCKANLMLLKLTNSPVSLEVVLENKKPDAALVVYAKPNEIQGPQWALLDQHRNVSVTNLRGRLMTDLLNAMMTTSYEKR